MDACPCGRGSCSLGGRRGQPPRTTKGQDSAREHRSPKSALHGDCHRVPRLKQRWLGHLAMVLKRLTRAGLRRLWGEHRVRLYDRHILVVYRASKRDPRESRLFIDMSMSHPETCTGTRGPVRNTCVQPGESKSVGATNLTLTNPRVRMHGADVANVPPNEKASPDFCSRRGRNFHRATGMVLHTHTHHILVPVRIPPDDHRVCHGSEAV